MSFSAGSGLDTYVNHSNRYWDEVIVALGLDPADIRILAPGESLEKPEIISRLKERIKHGKPMAESIVARDDLRLMNAARRRFGEYPRALKAAGINSETARLRIPKFTADYLQKLKLEMLRVHH